MHWIAPTERDTVTDTIEKRLWDAADQFRANSGLTAAQYSAPVLGLIFLLFAETRFAKRRAELESAGISSRRAPSRADDPTAYHAESVIFLPEAARFAHLLNLPEGANVGQAINDAMAEIEKHNPQLAGVLPRTFQIFTSTLLKELLKKVSEIPVSLDYDAFGRIYEYFLGQFARTEGQKGGEFYTPSSIVRLLVEVIEPFHGRILDPACGSGGMFVQSARFVSEHQKNAADELFIHGVEKTDDTGRLARMNLAIHGLEGDIRHGGHINSYYDDPFDAVGKFDFVLANPPFNVNAVDKDRLASDVGAGRRFPFGVPRTDNANYLWIQLFYSSLNEKGRAGFVMANSASDARSSEQELRRQLIEARAVDVMVAVGPNLFYTVTLPCTLWFMDKAKASLSPRPPSPQPSPRGRGGQYRGGYEFAGLVERARQLRRQPTTAEELMWSMLCERQFLSLKFRRQHQIGDYIVDFCCHDAMLVVELDGGVHDSQERSRADSRRDAYLMSLGFTVHRVPNERLLGDPASVLSDLARHLPSPAGRGVGGEGPLSLRRNVVVIADEAHRSQYDFIDGYARHLRDALPNASFIGFTGTPIELQDANTRAVFGDYISVYDIQRAVADGATVPIYYESRLAKLALDEAERPKIDPEFEEATEGEEVERKEKLKTRWAQLEAVVGAEKRLAIVARDIVDHFETRCEALEGKAMVVCMSRRICVELYREIVKLRPQWASDDDALGAIKVVMTGQAADPADWQPHIRNKPRREALANRFRDAADSLRMVLVRDMWLTGFDAPSLSTMYLDKPMRGHGLMQAIARVNRVFKDKPGGLVVDYLGLAQELKAALATYTESGGMGSTALDQDEAVAVMLEKYEVCCDLFGSFTTPKGVVGGFDWAKWTTGTPQERLGLLPPAQEHILRQDNGKERCVRAVRELSQAFALAVPHAEALRIRDDVAFFQAVQAVLAKRAPGDARPEEELDHAVRRIISRAVAPEGVMDIFAAAGLQKPDLSILSDEFLAEVRGMPQRNLAVELLQKLLKGEIATRRRKNVVQARSFAKMLGETIRRYQNRAIEAAQVIEELIQLAREMREASARGERFRLSEDELAFYDALETNDSAVKVLGDETLRAIARELVETVRKNVTIDWTLRENVRAQLRVLVKRILRNHGYPPDKQEKATQTVLEQAALLSGEWAGA